MRRVPLWVHIPALAGVLLILIGPVAIVGKMPWGEFLGQVTSSDSLAALRLGFGTAIVTTLACLILGVPMAIVFARYDATIIRVVRALVLLPLVLPPVVGGIALLYALGRFGLVGQYLDRVGVTLAFSTPAVVIAQTFVALPFLVLSVEGALRSAGEGYERTAATLGASPTRTLLRVTLPLTLPALIAGGVLAFARALGEFGATITFAGNLPGTTQTAPLKIYLDSINDPTAALPLSLVLMAVAMAVVVAVHLRRGPVAS
ncbi:MAG: ABC transporter permease [Gordonia sp. (in: high G+C Gram-positive bacteria)]